MVLQRPRQWGRAQHYSSEPCVGVDDDISEAADARVELRRARLHHQNIAGRHILPCGHEADLGGWVTEFGHMGLCSIQVAGPMVPTLRDELERVINLEA